MKNKKAFFISLPPYILHCQPKQIIHNKHKQAVYLTMLKMIVGSQELPHMKKF